MQNKVNVNKYQSTQIYLSFYLTNNSESCLCVLSGAIRLWNVDHEKNLQRQRPVSSHAISMPHPGSEIVWQDHQCRNKGSTTGLMDLPSLIIDRRHSLFGHICQGHTCFTSTTSIHWWLHWHTSCHWLEVLTGPSTENLASTGERKYGSTHHCLSIRNPGPVVEIATTLSRSSAAVSEFLCLFAIAAINVWLLTNSAW